MGDKSKIEWTDASWNPVRGCTKVSPGCANCYAETFSERFRGVKGHPYEQGFDLRLVPEKLDAPLRWKTPRRIFVNSMSDLFQDGVPDEFIDRVFAVMALSPWHTYQVLTKRADRMLAYCSALTFKRVRRWMNLSADGRDDVMVPNLTTTARATKESVYRFDPSAMPMRTDGPPFRNIWLGVSVENQHFADERIPLLLQTPAAVRFISAEPLLEHVDLTNVRLSNGGRVHALGGTVTFDDPPDGSCFRGLDWVIVGGENGRAARPFNLDWARSIVKQCQAAHVPVFVKQFGRVPFEGSGSPLVAGSDARLFMLDLDKGHGGDMAEWPEDLRVREFPEVQGGG